MNKRRFKNWEQEEIDEYWQQCDVEFRESVGNLQLSLRYIDEELKELHDTSNCDEAEENYKKLRSFFKRIQKQVEKKIEEYKIDPIEHDEE